jgi:cell division protein FtsI (penicillin-binding protein 3)
MMVRLPAWRARLAVALLLAAFLVLAGRSVYLQSMRTGFLQEKGEARYARVLEVPATRGRILDRNGEALAISTPVKSVWAIPEDVKADAAQLKTLAGLLQMDARRGARHPRHPPAERVPSLLPGRRNHGARDRLHGCR